MVRRGMTLLELAVAGTLLGTLLVVCLQLLQATAAQRRAADQRQLALVEVGNVLERVAARRWADLTSESVAGEKPSAWLGDRLPGAELKIELSAPSGEPVAKRIAVALRWRDRNGRYLPPVKITTWRYKIGDER
jgi:type II secretory pathway pseudopilin PulG